APLTRPSSKRSLARRGLSLPRRADPPSRVRRKESLRARPRRPQKTSLDPSGRGVYPSRPAGGPNRITRSTSPTEWSSVRSGAAMSNANAGRVAGVRSSGEAKQTRPLRPQRFRLPDLLAVLQLVDQAGEVVGRAGGDNNHLAALVNVRDEEPD